MLGRSLKTLCLIVIITISFSACFAKNNSENPEQRNNQSDMQNNSTNGVQASTSNSAVSESLDGSVVTSKSLTESKVNSIKADMTKRHYELLEYIAVKREAGLPLFIFSPEYVNILEGEGKYTINRNLFDGFFNSDTIYKTDSVSKLVDSEKKEVLTYDELMVSPEKYFVNNKAGFKYQKGDILVIFPPAKDSKLKDGWIGVYREENGIWNIVAGSFSFKVNGRSTTNETVGDIKSDGFVIKSNTSEKEPSDRPRRRVIDIN